MDQPKEKTRLPAWGMSLALHTVVALLLISLVRVPVNRGAPARTRTAGIVLAHEKAGDQWDYPDPAEAEQEAEQAGGQPATRGAQGGGEDARDLLPSGADAAELLMPNTQLPGAEGAVGSPDELLSYDLQLSGASRKPFLPGLDDEAILAEEAARRSAERALGPAARLSVFGSAAAEGRKFVFVIDRSKSMGGDGLNALAAARDELSRAIASLAPNHRFQILAYHHGCVYYGAPRLRIADREAKQGVAAFIDQLVAYGGTDHEMALRAALGMEPDVVFLLTDGGDPQLNDIQLKNIHKLAGRRTTIHCIQFGFRPSPQLGSFMPRLAQQNGGGYTYVRMSGS